MSTEQPTSLDSSTSPEQESPQTVETEVAADTGRKLRTWPAWIIALLAVGLIAARWYPTVSLNLMMAAFMGPAAAGGLMLLWWCFFSRASVKEKILGTIGFIAVVVIAVALLDSSMQDMATIVMVVPTAVLAFLLTLIFFAAQPKRRLPLALVVTALLVSYWETQKLEGLTGRFEAELLWRWEPTAEERYLAELAKRDDAAEPSVAAESISFASAPWPAFRGAERDGILHGVRVSENWKETPPVEVWRQKIGPGWSSFAIGGGRLFTQEQRGDNEAVICLDAETGKQIWDVTYPSRFWEAIGGAGPRATPTLTENALFSLGADGILLCLDPLDGREIWRRDLKDDAKRSAPQWGFSSSPLIADGNVIVHAGGEGDLGVIAYQTTDGKIAWSAPSGDHSYSSPQLATIEGTAGVLMMTNTGLDFLDPANGEVIWQHAWPVENYRALQPLVVGNSVYIATALQDGTRKVNVTKPTDDGPWETSEEWTTMQMKPDFNDFVFYEGNVYGFDGSVFACIDAETGDRQWKRGRYGNGQVLLLADAGQLLITTEKGEIVLAKASPDKLVEIAKLPVLDGKTWNHPVVVGDRLFVRNAKEIACYSLTLQ
ncbi:PQQ-binding-like beta-propeller repeat protein [Rhodopirellula sp. MGV]|uniref:PQQ-binding-like beta-propeller repeat protein n=1 Tax=Rhodopirellula sp. MGV TaxID=2023130 RepID=UPI00117B8DB6|nr:PQQ-binding-like beta-propeller repeat protein [Rhodopirellula sp. MGV]